MPATAEMSMAESHDGAVVIMITGTPFIALPEIPCIRFGTGLNHPERHTRSGISMPVCSRANKRIYIPAQILNGSVPLAAGKENKWQENQN